MWWGQIQLQHRHSPPEDPLILGIFRLSKSTPDCSRGGKFGSTMYESGMIVLSGCSSRLIDRFHKVS